jgi:hypothetical protein
MSFHVLFKLFHICICNCFENTLNSYDPNHRFQKGRTELRNKVNLNNNKCWEELIACIPSIRHGPCRKRRIQPPIILLLRSFVAARTFLRSRCLTTIKWIHIQTHRLMEGIYKVHRWDGFRCHYVHTKFHEDYFRYWKVDKEEYISYADIHTHRKMIS